jgi:hypothetical protein
MGAESIWPPGMSRGLFSTFDRRGFITVQSDDSGAKLSIDLTTGKVLERNGTFGGLEPELVGTIVASARAQHLNRGPIPIPRGESSNVRIYRNDAIKDRTGWLERKRGELAQVDEEKPAGDTAGE